MTIPWPFEYFLEKRPADNQMLKYLWRVKGCLSSTKCIKSQSIAVAKATLYSQSYNFKYITAGLFAGLLSADVKFNVMWL